MWICLSGAFISVVADRGDRSRLLVRGRVAGHIETVFPKAKVFTDESADYLYRAFVARDDVAQAVNREVQGIDYDNFKSSVPSQSLHDAYLGFWRIMHKLQVTFQQRHFQPATGDTANFDQDCHANY